MKKKQEVTYISYKEIICLAINEISREIDDYEKKCEGKGAEAQELIANITKPLMEKRELLKTLYRIETGTESDFI